jgi:hypothetical protein
MSRPVLEAADIFRDHGAAWRHANRGHVSLEQLKVRRRTISSKSLRLLAKTRSTAFC